MYVVLGNPCKHLRRLAHEDKRSEVDHTTDTCRLQCGFTIYLCKPLVALAPSNPAVGMRHVHDVLTPVSELRCPGLNVTGVVGQSDSRRPGAWPHRRETGGYGIVAVSG